MSSGLTLPVVGTAVIIAMLALPTLVQFRERLTSEGRPYEVVSSAFSRLLDAKAPRMAPPLPRDVALPYDLGVHEPAAHLKHPFGKGPPSENVVQEAAAQAAIDATAVLINWNSIDPSIFEAFHQLSGHAIDQTASLANAWQLDGIVDAKYSALLHGQQLSFAGHVAEHLQRDSLSHGSQTVHLFEASNHPGSDALINGHEVNFKNYQDAHQLWSHFQAHPNIPVVTNGDIAHAPANAYHLHPGETIDWSKVPDHNAVIVNHGVQHGDALGHVQHTQHVLDNHGLPTFDFNGSDHLQHLQHFQHAQHLQHLEHLQHFAHIAAPIPIGAVVVSSYREVNIYLAGDRDPADLARAARNIVIDVGSVGAGMAAGAKGGAAAGTFAGPHGTAVGAIVGGIGGAVGGRFVGKWIRESNLRAARETYDFQVETYKSAETTESERAELEWKEESDRINATLREVTTQLRERIETVEADAAALAWQELRLSHADASKLIDEASAIAHRTWKSPFKLNFWSRNIREDADRWEKRSELLVQNWTGSSEEIDSLFDLVVAAPGTARLVKARIAQVMDIRERCKLVLAVESSRIDRAVFEARGNAVNDAQSAIDLISEAARKALEQPSKALEASGVMLEQEMQRAGRSAAPAS